MSNIDDQLHNMHIPLSFPDSSLTGHTSSTT